MKRGRRKKTSKRSVEVRRKLPFWRNPSFWIPFFCLVSLLLVTQRCFSFLAALERSGNRFRRPTLVEIESGWTASRIGDELEEKGLVGSSLQFVVAAHREGVSRRLQAGRYLIPGGLSPRQIARHLASGAVFKGSFYVPNGSTLPQIAKILEGKNLGKKETTLNLARDSRFLGRLGVSGPSLEGYLYPDRYDRVPGETLESLLARMVGRFHQVATSIGLASSETVLARQGLVPLSFHETVVLASIIEREAGPDSEKPMVSRVFHNRLVKGMRLQSCATVHYVLGNWGSRISLVDLTVESPYNTYKRFGLPPGAICSPGKASLAAALHPVEGDWLFFVARGDGRNEFTQTYEEHLEACRRYLGRGSLSQPEP